MKALRILVVEDDVMIGGLLAETLEDLGHVVCAVETNAANAVAAAARHHPDLMIVDVGLGEASGVAAVNEILRAALFPTSSPPATRCETCRSGRTPCSSKSPSAGRTSFMRSSGRSRRSRPALASRQWSRERRLIAKTPIRR
jgi:hypothetical protein